MFRRRPRTTRTVTLCPYRRSSELAPAPDRAAGKIVGKVVVRRDPRPRSDPDALVGLARTEVDRIGRVEPVEMRRDVDGAEIDGARLRSEEHTSELQSLMRISYAVFCLNKNTTAHS